MTQIKQILKESGFDPRKGGPLKVILDAHINNPNYLEDRAIEMIHEARLALKDSGPMDVYHEKMQKAISLLAVARCIRNINNQNT